MSGNQPKKPRGDSANQGWRGSSAGSQAKFDPRSKDEKQSEPSRSISMEKGREVQGPLASGASISAFQMGTIGCEKPPTRRNTAHTRQESDPGSPSRERDEALGLPITLDPKLVSLKDLLERINTLCASSDREESLALGNKIELLLFHMDSLSEIFSIPPEGDVPELNRRENLRRDIEGVLGSSSKEQESQWLADKAQNAVRTLEVIQEAIFRYQQDKKTAIHVKAMGEMGADNAAVLRGVRCAEKAEYRHTGRDGCLKGTRGAVLDEIELWARFGSRSIYWLNGLAGTGKTTIAQTVGERLWAGGLLGASFFCSRYSPDRSDLQLIFPTIAVQLAREFPDFRSVFVPLVDSDPRVVDESPRDQLDKLICRPLAHSSIQTVIIIDALDECQDKESKSKILSALEDVLPRIEWQVKFFVTGRPEERIREGFLSKELSQETDECRLHEVAADQVRKDIRAFFIRHFSDLKSTRKVLGEWPTQEELNRVCERAAGLFVYAMATIRFIRNGKNPKQKLRFLLESPEGRCEGGTEFLDNITLDNLYMTILEEAFGSDDKAEDLIVQSVLGAVVLAANPISPNAIAALLKLDSEDVDPRLSSVQSVLLFEGNRDCTVRPFHNSFPDFIADPKRCKNARFCISPSHQHAKLLDQCLELMRTDHELTDDASSFNPPLQYACRSWFRHLVKVPTDMLDEIMPGLRIFLEAKFLLWLEALNTIGSEGEVVDGLEATVKRLNVPQTPNLIGILTDAAKKAVRKGDLFKALLKTIFAVYAEYKGPVTIRNEAEELLSCMASPGMSTAHPGDAAERECWRKLTLTLKDVEERLAPLYGNPQPQKPDDYVQHGKDLFRSLLGIQQAILDYLGMEQTVEKKRVHEPLDLSEAALLNSIPYARGSEYQYCGNPGCLEGTRKIILDEIELWARNFDAPPIFWLNGLAGTGKTAIARTVAERMFTSKRLGASFFCSGDFADWGDLRLIFPTLAVQLARTYPEFRSIFVPLILSDPNIAHESLYSQMDKLLFRPLVQSAISTVIVIDALDECRDEEPASAILSVLGRFVSEIPRVKFFVTGRPEPQIRNGFRFPWMAPLSTVFVLHEIGPSQVDGDIRRFFAFEFLELRSRRFGLGDWPTEEQLDILCKRAGGLFVYAVATVKFINQEGRRPRNQLDRLLERPASSIQEGRAKLDPLYMSVLRGAFGRGEDQGDDHRIRSVLGAVILSADPLSPHTIALLLDLDVEDVIAVLSSISSLLVLDEDIHQPVRPFHESFVDFMTDPDRCTDPRFCVHPPYQRVEILARCLNLMDWTLEQNMCDLPDGVNNSEVDDLRERVERNLNPALQYACKSWRKHLVDTTPTQTAETTTLLHQFLETKFLFWLEVLSLLGAAREAMDALEVTVKWSNEPSTSHLARDCLSFVTKFFDMIDTSAPQIYTSALSQVPQTSLVYGLYKQYAR